jgi:ParB family transcriptional regulator, chromosome partitioning protein
MGHARALLALDSAQKQSAACRKVIEQGLSVRQTEKLAAPQKPKEAKRPRDKDPNIVRIEDNLRRSLGTRVTLHTQKGNKGKIEIEYYCLDDLERILDTLRGA